MTYILKQIAEPDKIYDLKTIGDKFVVSYGSLIKTLNKDLEVCDFKYSSFPVKLLPLTNDKYFPVEDLQENIKIIPYKFPSEYSYLVSTKHLSKNQYNHIKGILVGENEMILIGFENDELKFYDRYDISLYKMISIVTAPEHNAIYFISRYQTEVYLFKISISNNSSKINKYYRFSNKDNLYLFNHDGRIIIHNEYEFLEMKVDTNHILNCPSDFKITYTLNITHGITLIFCKNGNVYQFCDNRLNLLINLEDSIIGGSFIDKRVFCFSNLKSFLFDYEDNSCQLVKITPFSKRVNFINSTDRYKTVLTRSNSSNIIKQRVSILKDKRGDLNTKINFIHKSKKYVILTYQDYSLFYHDKLKKNTYIKICDIVNNVCIMDNDFLFFSSSIIYKYSSNTLTQYSHSYIIYSHADLGLILYFNDTIGIFESNILYKIKTNGVKTFTIVGILKYQSNSFRLIYKYSTLVDYLIIEYIDGELIIVERKNHNKTLSSINDDNYYEYLENYNTQFIKNISFSLEKLGELNIKEIEKSDYEIVNFKLPILEKFTYITNNESCNVLIVQNVVYRFEDNEKLVRVNKTPCYIQSYSIFGNFLIANGFRDSFYVDLITKQVFKCEDDFSFTFESNKHYYGVTNNSVYKITVNEVIRKYETLENFKIDFKNLLPFLVNSGDPTYLYCSYSKCFYYVIDNFLGKTFLILNNYTYKEYDGIFTMFLIINYKTIAIAIKNPKTGMSSIVIIGITFDIEELKIIESKIDVMSLAQSRRYLAITYPNYSDIIDIQEDYTVINRVNHYAKYIYNTSMYANILCIREDKINAIIILDFLKKSETKTIFHYDFMLHKLMNCQLKLNESVFEQYKDYIDERGECPKVLFEEVKFSEMFNVNEDDYDVMLENNYRFFGFDSGSTYNDFEEIIRFKNRKLFITKTILIILPNEIYKVYKISKEIFIFCVDGGIYVLYSFTFTSHLKEKYNSCIEQLVGCGTENTNLDFACVNLVRNDYPEKFDELANVTRNFSDLSR